MARRRMKQKRTRSEAVRNLRSQPQEAEAESGDSEEVPAAVEEKKPLVLDENNSMRKRRKTSLEPEQASATPSILVEEPEPFVVSYPKLIVDQQKVNVAQPKPSTIKSKPSVVEANTSAQTAHTGGSGSTSKPEKKRRLARPGDWVLWKDPGPAMALESPWNLDDDMESLEEPWAYEEPTPQEMWGFEEDMPHVNTSNRRKTRFRPFDSPSTLKSVVWEDEETGAPNLCYPAWQPAGEEWDLDEVESEADFDYDESILY